MRVVAIRRGREWLIDPDDDQVLLPDDVLILRGAREGIDEVRELAGAPAWRAARLEEDTAITDLDRAVDVLVEMKNVSEASVGLAYSALLLKDQGLAAQAVQLEDRLDEMREQLELWVLRASAETVDPSGLRGLLHLGAAAEEIAVALGEADDVVVQYPIARGSALDGAVLSGTQVGDDTGFHLLAIRRDGRYLYRPRARVTLRAGDELLANGPWEGREALAEQCGFRIVEDDDTGAVDLVPVAN